MSPVINTVCDDDLFSVDQLDYVCDKRLGNLKTGEDLEANSIEILKGQLTSLLSFLVLKSEFFSTVNLNREVN